MNLKPRPTFVEVIKGLRKAHVFKCLFLDCVTTREVLNTRFTYCIENIMELSELIQLQKKKILLTKNKLYSSPQMYEPVLKTNIRIDVEDFLSTCVYMNMKKAMQAITLNVQWPKI